MSEYKLLQESDFICLDVDPKMLKRASDRAFNIGELKNSITSGKGNLAACLGEDVVKNYLKARYSAGKDKYNHDIIYKGQRLEVKTKRRTVDTLLHYEASIAKTSRHQKPDIYIFTSIKYENEKPKTVCIIGWIEFEEYFNRARFVPKNKLDKSNWFYAKADMYNIIYSDLKPMKELL